MAWTITKLKTTDGATLHVRQLLPSDPPKAIVQINHGMAEHGERYQEFAEALSAAGYGVYVHDHRGHGHTTAPDSAPGIFARKEGWERVMQDVSLIHDHISDSYPDTPVICFGHSMGAIIAFNHILRHPGRNAGAILWNSGVEAGLLAVVFGFILRVQRMFKGSDVPSGLALKATFEAWNQQFAPNRTAFDWLSRDEQEVDKYVNDPLCGFPVSISLWLDVLQGIYFAADNKRLSALPGDLPVHLLAGAQDPCSEHGKAVSNIAERLTNAKLLDVTLQILADTRHESLHETNRSQTIDDLINWLESRYATG